MDAGLIGYTMSHLMVSNPPRRQFNERKIAQREYNSRDRQVASRGVFGSLRERFFGSGDDES
jgi:hypothetical protein